MCPQVFDPAFLVREEVNESMVNALSCVPPFVVHNLISKMKTELDAYVRHAKSFTCEAEEKDIEGYTNSILKFWANNSKHFPTWGIAARIVFALSPNSAGCERVFSILKLYFGEQKDKSLADQIEAALMLKYTISVKLARV